MKPRPLLVLAVLIAAAPLPAYGGALGDLKEALRTPPPPTSVDEGTAVILSGRLSLEDAVRLALTHNRALLDYATRTLAMEDGRLVSP